MSPDLEYLNKEWTLNKVWALVCGVDVPDMESGDGYRSVPSQSWYQLRCEAVDNGRIESMVDVIQFEEALRSIPDRKVRAAVTLSSLGWEFADIGALIRDNRTGLQLVKQGVRWIYKYEQRRNS